MPEPAEAPVADPAAKTAEPEAAAEPVGPFLRRIRPILAGLITLASLGWAADIYRDIFPAMVPEQFLAFVLGLCLCLLYLHVPARRGTKRGKLPWYDVVAALLGLAAGLYTAYIYQAMIERMVDNPVDGLILSTIFFVLCMEGLRRTAGYTLVIVVLVFVGYTLIGHLMPGRFEAREVGPVQLVFYLALNTNALFGIALLVGVTIVFAFVYFGQLLSRSGGSEVFNDVAVAAMGRFRGGSAKIAITASGLFGSISGLAASNIMATGVITIPLMRRAGYRPHVAAAIEAVASTGGQLMPPVMGAVAFLMAEILAVPYGEIVLAALVPAILYYVALFIMADLEAAKRGIAPVERNLIPKMRTVMKSGWPFILPFVVLIGSLFWLNERPETSALYACGAVIVVGLLFGYGKTRLTIRNIFVSLAETGMSVLDVIMIVAAAGFILGALNLSGLGFILTNELVRLGEGNLVLLLVITAVMCIVLGMGMPTLSVYILLAVMIAPPLVQVGIKPIAAHMFMFYFGMMSFITPPVAIAAFFAANLAGSKPMQTGFTAMRMGWTAYIVPFLFVFAPVLLLQEGTVLEFVLAVASAVAGVWLVCAGMNGYFVRPMGWPLRIGFIVAGLALMTPRSMFAGGLWVDLAGLALGIVLVAWEWTGVRRAKAEGAGSAPAASATEP